VLPTVVADGVAPVALPREAEEGCVRGAYARTHTVSAIVVAAAVPTSVAGARCLVGLWAGQGVARPTRMRFTLAHHRPEEHHHEKEK
jgi:hypothetical protein